MYQDVLVGNSAACFDDTPVMAANIKQHCLGLKIPEGFENQGSEYSFAIMDTADQELLAMLSLLFASLRGILFGLLGTVQSRVCRTISAQRRLRQRHPGPASVYISFSF